MKIVPLLLALLVAAPALGKDVCVTDADGRDYRFENPKLPKKQGKITPILGSIRTVPAEVDGFSWGPFQGSAMTVLGTDDSLVISFFAQTANGWLSVRMAVNRTFTGSVSVNIDGDPSFEDSVVVTPIDCDESTLP